MSTAETKENRHWTRRDTTNSSQYATCTPNTFTTSNIRDKWICNGRCVVSSVDSFYLLWHDTMLHNNIHVWCRHSVSLVNLDLYRSTLNSENDWPEALTKSAKVHQSSTLVHFHPNNIYDIGCTLGSHTCWFYLATVKSKVILSACLRADRSIGAKQSMPPHDSEL